MARSSRCNNYLPEEIIFIVLSWLPVKTLLRFKSVCKSWRFMISDNQFVQTHLTNSHRKQTLLLNYKEFDDHIDVHYTLQDSYKLYLPPNVTATEYIYSCDGLICLPNHGCDVIYLWNPSTKLLKKLPTPSKDLSVYQVILGLGFDPISNDYKLFRIGFKYHLGVEAELYSSKSDSWKEIQVPDTLQNFECLTVNKTVHIHTKPGVLYLTNFEEVLAFDLHEEVFLRYPVPRFPSWSNILDFEGYVALVLKQDDESALSLFVLNDDCDKVFWSKLFNLEGKVKISGVVRYLGMEKFLILNASEETRFTYIYDYKMREAKKSSLKLYGDAMSMTVKYTESLVFLDGFKPQD